MGLLDGVGDNSSISGTSNPLEDSPVSKETFEFEALLSLAVDNWLLIAIVALLLTTNNKVRVSIFLVSILVYVVKNMQEPDTEVI